MAFCEPENATAPPAFRISGKPCWPNGTGPIASAFSAGT